MSEDGLTQTIARALAESDEEFDPEWDYTFQASAMARLLDRAGYVIVPREPTDAMNQAGLEAIVDLYCGEAPAAYRAMIRAAITTGETGNG